MQNNYLTNLKRVIEIHQNPAEAKKRGKAGRQFAVQNLDWDLIAKQFDELITSRIGMKHPMTQMFDEVEPDE